MIGIAPTPILTSCGHHRRRLEEIRARDHGRMIPAAGARRSCSFPDPELGDGRACLCLADWVYVSATLRHEIVERWGHIPREVIDRVLTRTEAEFADQVIRTLGTLATVRSPNGRRTMSWDEAWGTATYRGLVKESR